jgi:type VII secretion protein EssB
LKGKRERVKRMENEMQERIKQSALNANGPFDYEKLVYPMPYFLPCTMAVEPEEILFTYDCTGMKPASALKQEGKRDQYQFLINFQKLSTLLHTYRISLTAGNVYYDENFLPHVKQRDLYAKGESYQEEEFLFLYKTFIGGILGTKYEVKTLQESGLEVLKKDASFQEFHEAKDSEALAGLLRIRKESYLKREKETKVSVRKSTDHLKTVVSIATPLLLLACAGYLAYMAVWKVPFQEQVIAAHEGYVASDYVAGIDAMKEVEPSEMDISTKYVLAVSYARSESLKKEELEGIIAKLSLKSNEKELEYWIYLGRRDAAKAADLAKALSDDKLLIYAYMKELSLLEGDTQITGEDKESRISELEEKIKSLGEKYTNEEEEAEESTPADAEAENAEAETTETTETTENGAGE